MKKIFWYCDKCRELIDRQTLIYDALEEKHLQRVCCQDWCNNCVDEIFKKARYVPGVNSPVSVKYFECLCTLESDLLCPHHSRAK